MLYFSETGWTLPDIREVEEAFGREYDMSEYEQAQQAAGGVEGKTK